MGGNASTLSLDKDSSSTLRLMSYNVEWGFLNLPNDIHSDSCGHPIPNTPEAQKEHLNLISKNIGFLTPDICFLQEMGSLQAVQYISDQINQMFGIKYDCNYSNGNEQGNQGVGLLIKESLTESCSVCNIPNFRLNRALGVTLKTSSNTYKIVGVHLKSLYDQKIQKDEEEQKEQLQSVIDWIGNPTNAIICGDLNNVPTSSPIQLVKDNSYEDILASDKYVDNITGNTYTEFHGKNGKESGSKIDYIFKTNDIDLVSSHIIDIQREASNQISSLRGENSDHLPVIGIFTLQ